MRVQAIRVEVSGRCSKREGNGRVPVDYDLAQTSDVALQPSPCIRAVYAMCMVCLPGSRTWSFGHRPRPVRRRKKGRRGSVRAERRISASSARPTMKRSGLGIYAGNTRNGRVFNSVCHVSRSVTPTRRCSSQPSDSSQPRNGGS